MKTLFVSLTVCLITFACGSHLQNDLFEGDILRIRLSDNESNKESGVIRSAAPVLKVQKWPKGIVPYLIESSFGNSERRRIKEALEYFMDAVAINGMKCIEFVPRTNEQDYVKIINGSHCYSYIGRQGLGQTMSLQIATCLKRNVIVHEFMHSLGFEHEQSRPDRDKYVKIQLENIQETIENFLKYRPDDVSVSGPYDYASIMHYGPYHFTKNGNETIVQLREGPKIGESKGLSENDILEIRSFYGCSANVTSKPKLILPLNIYSGDSREHLKKVSEAARKINIVTVINVGNVSKPDSNIIKDLTKLKSSFKVYRGSFILGYVSTDFGARPISEIKSDILDYSKWPQAYRPNGIFFAEQSNHVKDLGYYKVIYDYAKSKFDQHSSLVITSPKSNLPNEYFCECVRSSDSAVVFENSYSKWRKRKFHQSMKARNRSEHSAMVYACPQDRMQVVIREAVGSNIEYVYVTDEVKTAGNVLWSKLPSYFDEEVEFIASFN